MNTILMTKTTNIFLLLITLLICSSTKAQEIGAWLKVNGEAIYGI
jgi:hypothetical protein